MADDYIKNQHFTIGAEAQAAIDAMDPSTRAQFDARVASISAMIAAQQVHGAGTLVFGSWEAAKQGREIPETMPFEDVRPGERALLCAQCVLNGSGAFLIGSSGRCPNPSCAMEAFKRANTTAPPHDRAAGAPPPTPGAKVQTPVQYEPKPAKRKIKSANNSLCAKGGTLTRKTERTIKTAILRTLQNRVCEKSAELFERCAKVQYNGTNAVVVLKALQADAITDLLCRWMDGTGLYSETAREVASSAMQAEWTPFVMATLAEQDRAQKKAENATVPADQAAHIATADALLMGLSCAAILRSIVGEHAKVEACRFAVRVAFWARLAREPELRVAVVSNRANQRIFIKNLVRSLCRTLCGEAQ